VIEGWYKNIRKGILQGGGAYVWRSGNDMEIDL
jgi:hypothetical protein